MEQQSAPAPYLPFQLDLQSVPLAQKEIIEVHLPGLRAWGSSEQVADLAIVAPF